MDLIEDLIIDISKMQKDFYDEIEKEVTHKINYSSKRIDHLYKDTQLSSEFMNYFEIYIIRISSLINSDRIDELSNEYRELYLRVRDKERKSLKEKIVRYKTSTEEGKVPIQKCINDLLGFRIVTNADYRNNADFKKMCEKLKKDKVIYSFYTRTDEDYKGIHLYFKNKSNLYLPWELQIWHQGHMRSNYESHLLHKKNYLK